MISTKLDTRTELSHIVYNTKINNIQMKTAEQLRELAGAVNPGITLAQSMNILCTDAAESRGKTSFSYLIHKVDHKSEDIDWAISEMVAKGFSIDVDEAASNDEWLQLIIKW